MTLLEVSRLSKRFRGLKAVDQVSFAVEERSITALIGPNGAGKTTCFNMIAGMTPPSAGTIRLAGREVAGLAPEDMCGLGVARTFQVVRPLAQMSVLDNVMVGALHRIVRPRDARAWAMEVLERVGLVARAKSMAAELTLQDRKILEVARALATRPRLLMLDEVMAGARHAEADRMVELLRKLNADGLTILLTEHVMRIVMSIAHKVVVLHHGAKIAEGAPQTVVADARVIESYLGRRSRA